MNDAPRKIRVMVVDDSAVIRGFFTTMLEADPDIKIVASAANGQIAVNLLKRDGPGKVEVDIVTLDIEMPVMDGLAALPEILKLAPKTKVIMASSLSTEGAKETLNALSLGAADYTPKPTTLTDRAAMVQFSRDIIAKTRALAGFPPPQFPEAPPGPAATPAKAPVAPAPPKPLSATATVAPTMKLYRAEDVVLRPAAATKVPDAIAIGCSTGGPQALTFLFRSLKGKKFGVPVFITQHMPPQFTTMLANQIQDACGSPSAEGKDGETVEPGRIYLAPGDYHMLAKKQVSAVTIELNRGPQENFCRPAVDPMLRSLTDCYGDRLLVLIMTGMGLDGLAGCRQVVDKGGVVFAQDKASSVVWGMPGAVATAGVCSRMVALNDIPATLIQMAQGKIA